MVTSRKKRFRWLWAALWVSVSPAHGQGFDWTVTLANGEELTQVALTRLTPDSLIVTAKSNFSEWIVLDSVVEVRRQRRSAVLPATLIGAAGGGGIGYALTPPSVQQGEANIYSVVFGGVIGGVAGFLVGSNLQADEVVDVRTLNRASKFEALSRLLERRE